MNPDEYVDAAYIRAKFRMSESTLYRAIRDKRFPAPFRLGHERLWPKAIIVDFEKKLYELSRQSYRVSLYV